MAPRAGSPAASPEPAPERPPKPVSGEQVRRYRVFIASPGDVNAARDAVPAVLDEINRTRGRREKFVLEPWDWRDDAPRGLGEPQDLINPALAEADVVLGIFHNRFGSPTPRAKSGSAEEILQSIGRFQSVGRPHVLFFVCEEPTNLTTREQLEQKMSLVDFLGQLPPRIDRKYRTVEQFSAQLRVDLQTWLVDQTALAATAVVTHAAGHAVVRAEVRFDSKAYFDHVEATIGSVEVPGINTDRPIPPLPLREIYTSLRASDSDSAEETKRKDPSERLQESADSPHAIPIEQVLKKNRTLLIEGAPGSGKTTVLRRLALALIDAHLADPADARRFGFTEPFPIPVVVALSRFRAWLTEHPDALPTADTLIAYLEEKIEPLGGKGWIRPRLEAGGIALLLDGLDEVPDRELRSFTAQLVRAFAVNEAWSRCRLALSSRPGGLEDGVREILRARGGLAQAQVQPLNPEERRSFVTKWYAALLPDRAEAETRANDLLSRIEASRAVADLTDTPIMLTAVTVVHYNGRTLPDRRAELYQLCVGAMLHKWSDVHGPDDRRLCDPLAEDEKFDVVQELAYITHRQGKNARAIEIGRVRAVVQERLKALRPQSCSPAVAAAITSGLAPRTGLLIPGEDHDLVFRHLTFQEFLVARRLCDRVSDVAEILGPKLDDPWWSEVVALAVGYRALNARQQSIDLVRALIASACQRPKPARVAALATVGRAMLDLRSYRTPGVADVALDLAPTIVELIEDSARPGSVKDRALIASLLGSFGHPDPRLTPDRQWIDVPGGEVWIGEADDKWVDRSPRSWNEPMCSVPARVGAFQIQRWATTVGELKRFLDAQPASKFEHLRTGQGAAQFLGAMNSPATFVDVDDATAYCAWASTLPENRGFVVRLPVDDEWELAARGAVKLADERANPSPKRAYPWGDDFDPLKANVSETDVNGAVPVGLFAGVHGPYGTWDQAGNVWEWTSSPHDRANSADRNRAVRGGCFGSVARGARVSYRGWSGPGDRGSFLGFRPLRVAAE